MVNKKRVLEEFMDLVQVRCSTHDEREIADILKQKAAVTLPEHCKGSLKILRNCGGQSLFGRQGRPVFLGADIYPAQF